jgi:hypothetical protein
MRDGAGKAFCHISKKQKHSILRLTRNQPDVSTFHEFNGPMKVNYLPPVAVHGAVD